MSAAALLALDTTAPVIAWGAVAGARPGQAIQLAYTINEPEVLSAELQTSAASTPLVVSADRLTGQVPADITAESLVRAFVGDHVGNQAVRELTVTLKQTSFEPGEPGRVETASSGRVAGGGAGHVGSSAGGRIDRGRGGRIA